MDELFDRGSGYEPAAYTVVCTGHLMDTLPVAYRSVTGDAHSPHEPAFQDEARGIRQIRPSSTPVFEITGPTGTEVLKLGRSRYHVEREFHANTRLRATMPVVPMAIRYIGSEPVLIMPRIDGSVLSKVATVAPSLFMQVVEDVMRRVCDSYARMGGPCTHSIDTELPTTASRLGPWIDNVLAYSEHTALTAMLTVNGRSIGVSVAYELGDARRVLDSAVNSCMFFTGDNHLRNFIVCPDGTWHAIDFEFGGHVDVNLMAAKFVGSLVKDLDGIASTSLTYDSANLTVAVTYGYVNDQIARLCETDWIWDRLASIPLDMRRVRAYVLADLTLRLKAVWNGGDDDATRAIAMVACALHRHGAATRSRFLMVRCDMNR